MWDAHKARVKKKGRVSIRNFIPAWSVLRQIVGKDKLGTGDQKVQAEA